MKQTWYFFRFKNMLWILLAATAFWSCSNDLEDPGTLSDVQPTFLIDLFEALNNGDRTFLLHVATIEDRECLNYNINYTLVQQGSMLDLSLNDIEAPADCLPGLGPAQELITIGELENGLYSLNVQLRNTVSNEGQLIVSEEAFELYFNNPSGLTPVRENLLRIPIGTLWGFVGYEAPDLDTVAQQFISELGSLSPSSHSLAPGYYGYFSIDTNESTQLSESPDVESYWPIVQSFGSTNDIQSLVNSFRSNFPDLIIELRDEQGRNY